MRLHSVGELIDRTTYWELVYDVCGHSPQFARHRREEVVLAAKEATLNYGRCLTCYRSSSSEYQVAGGASTV